MKSAEEIMNMLEALDLTGSLRDAGELAGVSHHTVARYVAARDAGALSDRAAVRRQLIDEYLPKIEEWVERSKGKVRADVAHDKLVALAIHRVRAHHAPRGRCGQGQLPGRADPGPPPVGDRVGGCCTNSAQSPEPRSFPGHGGEGRARLATRTESRREGHSPTPLRLPPPTVITTTTTRP